MTAGSDSSTLICFCAGLRQAGHAGALAGGAPPLGAAARRRARAHLDRVQRRGHPGATVSLLIL